jgi:hypothetical protein
MKKKTLYIIIAILLLLNIGQFIYFYKIVSDLKVENKILKYRIKIVPEIENDSINDEPIPAPKDNDTIITPEQEKKANELGY